MEENKNEVVETTEETKVEETKTEEVKKEDSESAKEIEHLKKLLSKANSEAADYKKQLRSKMSEDEVKAAENEAGDYRQLSLFDLPQVKEVAEKEKKTMQFEHDDASKREKRMQEAVLKLRDKFGKNAVLKGMNLEEGATMKERNKQIGGHKA